MRYLLTVALLFPLLSLAQGKTVLLGHWDKPLNERSTVDDTFWKINGMEEGCIATLELNNLVLSVNAVEGGGVVIAGGCRSDGTPSEANTAWVRANYPVLVSEGTRVLWRCPAGKLISLTKP